MARPIWLLLTGVVVVVQTTTASRAADATPAKTAAKTLLEKGWDKTAAARAVADQPELDKPPLTDDAFVLAARWLVLMYQGRFDDGLTNVDKFLQAKPTHLLALRAKAWAYTMKHNYNQAMVSADQLSQAVQSATANQGQPAASAADAEIEFLGRLSGFLQGPMEKNADQAVRQKFEARVVERLDERGKKVFEEAKASVLDEYNDLIKDAATAKQETQISGQVAKEVKLTELSEENSKISEEANKLQDQTNKLKEDLKNRLAELDRQDAPLAQKQVFLQGQITSLSTQLNQQQSLLQQYQQQANSSNNSSRSTISTPEMTRVQNAIANLRGQLDVANNQLGMTNLARANLQQQRIAAGGGAMMQGQQLENMRQGVERNKLKNEAKQKRAEKSKPTANVKVAALENEARAYSTYDSFPFEELRETLLSKAR